MDNLSTERWKLLRNIQKEMLELKNTVTKLNNVFNGLINTLDTAMERISELEGISIETSQTKMHRERRMKKAEQSILALWDNRKSCGINNGNTTRRERKNLKSI